MAEETRQEIEAVTERIKQELRERGESAREKAYMIAEHGLNIGDAGNKLCTGGAGDWEAPKLHPVWAPELAHEVRGLKRMGAATFEYEPTARLLDEWAEAGKPEIGWDDEHDAAQPLIPLPTRAEQQAYEDRLYGLLEDRAHAEGIAEILTAREQVREAHVTPLLSHQEGRDWLQAFARTQAGEETRGERIARMQAVTRAAAQRVETQETPTQRQGWGY